MEAELASELGFDSIAEMEVIDSNAGRPKTDILSNLDKQRAWAGLAGCGTLCTSRSWMSV